MHELAGLRVAGAEDVGEYAPCLAHLVGASGAAQLGVGGEHALRVAGHVDFGNDGDVSVGGIVHDVAHLVLGVEASVGYLVVNAGDAADDGACPFGTDFRELGVTVYLHAPALVFGEVPVEGVEVVECEHVDEFLDEFGLEVVAAAVEHRSAVAEAGIVDDACGGEGDALCLFQGQRLAERLHTVEHAARCFAFDGDAFGLHGDDVAFFLLDLGVELERDGGGFLVRSGRIDARGLANVFLQECRVAQHGFVGADYADGGVAVEHKGGPFLGDDALRKWHYLIIRVCGMQRESRHHHCHR